MTGPTTETSEHDAPPTPRDMTRTAPTPASALEVAGLRERLDGVSTKLHEIDHRVEALEAAADGVVNAAQGSGSEQGTTDTAAAPKAEAATGSMTTDTLAAQGSTRGFQAEAGTVTTPEPADILPARTNLTPSSVVLMLTDGQFERLLGDGRSTPDTVAQHDVGGRERTSNWRLGRNTARTAARPR